MARCAACILGGILAGLIVVPAAAMVLFEFTDCDLFDTDTLEGVLT